MDVCDSIPDAVVNPLCAVNSCFSEEQRELCGGAQLKIWHHKTNILVIYSQ